MLSRNQQLKRDFDNLWKQKLENSRYDLEESNLENFSSRQCGLGKTLVFYNLKKVKPKLEFGKKIDTKPYIERQKIVGKVVKKPSYIDEYGKERHGGNYGRDGYLVCQEQNGDIFYASTRNVFAILK